MKRLGYFAAILFIALCFFASAYGERTDPVSRHAEASIQQQEAQLLEAEMDKLAEGIDQLNSDIAIVKIELIKSGKTLRHASQSR
jgi:hypothetical protein